MSKAVSSAVLVEPESYTDEELAGHVLAGETALFELVMRRHNERLYRVARAITKDEREAEDVLQQSYLNAFANLRQFNGNARLATWLTRITINEALARVKRSRKFEPFDETGSTVEPFDPQSVPPSPERQAFTGELRNLLEWAIDGLADGAREVFMLRDVEGMSTAEAAEVLGVSADVVKTRLSRARASLRRALLARTGAATSEAFRFQRPRCDRVVAYVLARISTS